MIIYAKLQSSRVRHQYGLFGVNRRRPSWETPLGPGAKKDGCFRRRVRQIKNLEKGSHMASVKFVT